MKIKSYKDGNKVKRYVSTGKEKKAVVGAIMTGIQGLASLGTGITDYNRGFDEASRRTKEIARLKATAPSLETPASFQKAVKDAYDRSLLESQQREITRQLGTSVGSLQQAGGRALLGGIGAATQQASLAGQTAAQAQAKTRLEALTNLGQAELSTQKLREDRYQRELEAQREMRAQAEASAGAGLGSAIGGALSFGTVGLGAAGALGGDIKKAMLGDFTKGSGTDAFIPKVFPKTLGLKIDPRLKYSGGLTTEGGLDFEDYENKFKKGGVTKTKGEFSHEKNPIDLVQNGQKVGEATGGEYIFNPQQSEKMKELAKQATEARSEDKRLSAMEKLAKFVRELLNRFEKDTQ